MPADAGEAGEAGDCGEASGRDRLGYLLSRIHDLPYHYGSQWGEIEAERDAVPGDGRAGG
jgi:hypothetical protein